MDNKDIINLLTKQNEEVKQHFNIQIKALQEVHEVNHDNLYAIINEVKKTGEETHTQAYKTNGRVSKIENELYGYLDPHGNVIKDREGFICDINKYKKRILYVGSFVALFIMSLQIPPIKAIVEKIIYKIF